MTKLKYRCCVCVCVHSTERGNRRSASLPECVRFQAAKNIPVPPCTHNRSVFCDNQPRSNLEGRLKRRRTTNEKSCHWYIRLPLLWGVIFFILVFSFGHTLFDFCSYFLRRRPRWFYDDRKYWQHRAEQEVAIIYCRMYFAIKSLH